ncbi:MAG TPA: sulfurtransferase [Negativicutes bacterium]
MTRRQKVSFCRTKIFAVLLIGALAANLVTGLQFQTSVAGAAISTAKDQGYIHNATVVKPEELNELISEGTVKVIDVRPQDSYQKEHIVGAVNLSLNDYGDAKHLIPLPEHFAGLLSNLGISNQDTIVLYADNQALAYVAHCWWLLAMFGHHEVKMLDGGLDAWRTAGYQVTNAVSKVAASNYQIQNIDTSKLATIEEVIAASAQNDPKVILLDVRELAEFTGDVQVKGAARKGRIPGAVWLYWGDTLNPDKTLKNAGELRKLFYERGVTPDKTIITYCQAGVRAAHTVYVLSELLGYKNVKNYAGSWAEWSQRHDLPVETGVYSNK